ncbi:MAG: hypothetical protein ACO3FL_04390 [Ilumatobacteraceae bacterium]
MTESEVLVLLAGDHVIETYSEDTGTFVLGNERRSTTRRLHRGIDLVRMDEGWIVREEAPVHMVRSYDYSVSFWNQDGEQVVFYMKRR